MRGCIARHATILGLAAIAAWSSAAVLAQDVLGEAGVRGAGSTFVYPVLSRWSREYRVAMARGGEFPSLDGGLEDPPASTALEYEPIGSLAGTLRAQTGAVDFGASDVPMTSSELSKLGLHQFPIVIGGVAIAVNVDGVTQGSLRLTGTVAADIFLGRIRRWSAPALVALNPGLKLPDSPITVLHRSDGSGTTFNFTHYLVETSAGWKSSVGADLLVKWPTGSEVKGNDGMARAIQTTRGSIGYLDYAQAVQAKLAYVQLQNRTGAFIRPSTASFQAAAAGADWSTARDFHMLLTNVPAQNAYPITATVFVLMKKGGARGRQLATLDFFRWSLAQGAATAKALGYVPLPSGLVQQVNRYWDSRVVRPGPALH